MSKLLTLVFRRPFSTLYPLSPDLSAKQTFYAKDIVIQKADTLKQLPPFDVENLVFGRHSTDHMLSIQFDSTVGWGKPTIKPFGAISVHPFNSSLHYAVQCFEGMKAYKDSEGKIRLFRPECNAQRFKKSSERIALPDFDGNEMIKCIEEYVRLESRWIPSIREFSLYLRPLHMAMENSLGVKHPNKSLMMIMASPAGPYYPTGFKPISLSCGVGTIRSAPGGMGMFKVGGNYGPTLGTTQEANKKGHQQVLWLFNDTKIIQVGASNIFFVFKSKTGKKAEIVTPAIQDLILPGVTRDSIIEYLKRDPQFEVVEREITIQQVIERNDKGQLLESFSSGTAVVIGSIENIQFKGVNHKIYIDPKLKAGPVTVQIRDKIVGIQEGKIEDTFGWTRVIN